MELGGGLWGQISESSLLVARLGGETEDGIPHIDSASTLFVHGGIDVAFLETFLGGVKGDQNLLSLIGDVSLPDALNLLTKLMLTSLRDSLPHTLDPFLMSMAMSPLWTRDLANLRPEYVCHVLLAPILKKFQVARVIVGHTPQLDRRMKSLCGSRVILADAAMSKWIIKRNWSADEDSLPVERDPHTGLEIVGNPTVLVLETGYSTQLQSMEALYFDIATSEIITENFFPLSVTDRTARVYIPLRAAYPRNVARIGGVRSNVTESVYEFRGLAYNFLATTWIVPLVAVMHQEEWHRTDFYFPDIFMIGQDKVHYQLEGDSLRSAALTETKSGTGVRNALFHQIFESIVALRKKGYSFGYDSRIGGGDAADIFDKFVIQSESGILKLVDYSEVVGGYDQRDCNIDLAHVLLDLVELVKDSRTMQQYVFEVLRTVDLETHVTGCLADESIRWMSQVELFKTIWSPSWIRMVPLADSEKGTYPYVLNGVELFEDAQLHGMVKVVDSDIRNNLMLSDVLKILIDSSLLIVNTQQFVDGVLYVIVSGQGVWLGREVDISDKASIVDQIQQIMQQLHENNLLLFGVLDMNEVSHSPRFLLTRFMLDAVGAVRLFDFTTVGYYEAIEDRKIESKYVVWMLQKWIDESPIKMHDNNL